MSSGELSTEYLSTKYLCQRFTWKLPGFFQLRWYAETGTKSRNFVFAGVSYRLQLYPFGMSDLLDPEAVCIIDLKSYWYLCDPFKSKPNVSCELRLKSRTGNEIELKRNSCYVFFISRRELEENRYSYVPDDTLTLICYMNVVEPSSVGGPHPEEEQKGLPGVVELQSDYRQLLKKGAESDACLVVSGKEFRAHKNILRARSPVFDAMFGHETAEKKSGLVVIDDLDPEIFGEFLEYLYTGCVGAGLSNNNAFGLYMAADKYDVPTLKSECVAYMRRNLSVECFSDVMTVALRHSEEDLQQQTARFFKENLERIIVTPKWKQFVIDSGTSVNELLIKAFVPGEQ